MQVLVAKRQEEICTERYSKELRNQNGQHLVNLYESINLEKPAIFQLVHELTPFFGSPRGTKHNINF